MAYPQLGYPYSPSHQFLMTSSSLANCLEPGGRSLMNTGMAPPSQSSLRCPVYESRLLSSPGHDLTPTAGIGIYGETYAKSQGYYATCSGDATALYSRNTLDSKDGVSPAQAGASQTPSYYPYDYAFGQYPYDRYGYGCSDGASRRKNATRETTSTLKTWLQEHQKNPYPTKGEKIMLAIITKMTLTQVSTWFANARRRLKKENKVTWSPRANKSSEERGCEEDSDGEEGSPQEEPIKSERDIDDNGRSSDLRQSDLEDFDLESDGSDCDPKQHFHTDDISTNHLSDLSNGPLTHIPDTLLGKERLSTNFPKLAAEHDRTTTFYTEQDPRSTESKPKIWSIAQTAISLNPAIQPEYPPCMLISTDASSPGYPSDVGLNAGRHQDSPVATLREWVDGVFHDPLFRQRSPTLPKPTAAWIGLNAAAMENRTLACTQHITSSLQHA